MPYISYDNLGRCDIYNNNSAKSRFQDKNFSQLKLKVNPTIKKDEKIPTKFEAGNDGGFIKKAFLDTIFSRREGQISYLENE